MYNIYGDYMTIYLDIVFLENLFMNFCIIYASSLFSNKKKSIYRMIIAGIIGSLYYVAILIPQTYFLTYTIFKVLLSIIMVLVAFKYTDLYSFVQDLVIFLITSCMFGGVMYGLYYYIFNKLTIPYYPVKLIIFGAGFVIILLKVCIHRIRCNMAYRKIMYSVEISLNGRTKKIKGFLDTGNSLKDPITSNPILLVNFEVVKNILPKDVVTVCQNNLYSLTSLSKESERRVRLLPYISVGNQNGLMLGYKMDKIKIYLTNEENIVLDNALIGINTTKLNNQNDFDALLSIELLELQRGRKLWEECNLKS